MIFILALLVLSVGSAAAWLALYPVYQEHGIKPVILILCIMFAFVVLLKFCGGNG